MEITKDVEKIRHFLVSFKNSRHQNATSSVAGDNLSKSKRQRPENNDEFNNKKLENLKECLKYNEKCTSLMVSTEAYLHSLLESCLKEQDSVNKEISSINGSKVLQGKRITFRIFGTPYFKDQNGFSAHLNNADLIEMNKRGFTYMLDAPHPLPWSDKQKLAVERAVKKQIIEKRLKCKEKLNEEADVSLKQLVGSSFEEYDWMKISVIDLSNERSPAECRALWFNYLHPQRNKTLWTKSEEKKLKELVKQYENENWDRIAEKLNTKRSAFQCIHHYQINLADHSKSVWTKQEDADLEMYINKFCVGHYIPWGKVACFMGAQRSQIYRHWECIRPDAKKGKYSLKEDLLIVAGYKYFGQNFSRIGQYIPNRNNIQVRSRLKLLQARVPDTQPWTEEEDKLINSLIKKFGLGNLGEISRYFNNRSAIQIRARYLLLKNKKEEIEYDVQETKRIDHYLYGATVDMLWEKVKSLIVEKNISSATVVNENEGFKVMSKLSKLLIRPKSGRRPFHNKQIDKIAEGFFKYFCCAYIQRSGRGKVQCTKDQMPQLAIDVIWTLRFLGIKIKFPRLDKIDEEGDMLYLDRNILKYIVDKENFQALSSALKCGEHCVIQPVYPEAVSYLRNIPYILDPAPNDDNIYLCPPSFTTIVGLRTLILSRQNLKEQSERITVNDEESSPRKQAVTSYKLPFLNADFATASKRFESHLHFLFTWPALMSKQPPILDIKSSKELDSFKQNTNGISLVKSPLRKLVKGRRKSKTPRKAIENISENTHKRKYVKSGKYSINSNIPLRKSPRISSSNEK